MKEIIRKYTLLTLMALFLCIPVIMSGTKTEAASSVEAALSATAKEAGFIAISESGLNYADAVAFCKRHGGRLPRIDNSNSWDGTWDGKDAPEQVLMDGFGYWDRDWDETGLPEGDYWSGTAVTGEPGHSWIVHSGGGNVNVGPHDQGNVFQVVCVP